MTGRVRALEQRPLEDLGMQLAVAVVLLSEPERRGHNCIGHNYIGHNYTGQCQVELSGGKVSWQWSQVSDGGVKSQWR